VGSLLFKKR